MRLAYRVRKLWTPNTQPVYMVEYKCKVYYTIQTKIYWMVLITSNNILIMYVDLFFAWVAQRRVVQNSALTRGFEKDLKAPTTPIYSSFYSLTLLLFLSIMQVSFYSCSHCLHNSRAWVPKATAKTQVEIMPSTTWQLWATGPTGATFGLRGMGVESSASRFIV